MSDLDLDDIRARLRASASERRSPSRTLSSLIRGKPPAPLLGPPALHARPPAPPPPLHEEQAGEEEPLLLGGDLAPPLKRSAFGRRQPPVPQPEPVAIDEEVASGRLRLRSPLSLRWDESVEPPFLPEDLEDPRQDRPERAGAPAPGPTSGERVLLQLEKRLLEEHVVLIRTLAGG